MPADFHSRAFDEGTITKLELFQLYAREWFPVFLAAAKPKFKRIRVYDFFAGPGTDGDGNWGSPLRLLKELYNGHTLPGWNNVTVHCALFDKNHDNIALLENNISRFKLRIPAVQYTVKALQFREAWKLSEQDLRDASAAKLVFIDQFGVDQVGESTFKELIDLPSCDFIFFISSSVLHRFRTHPAIKLKIDRPEDYYHVHRKVVEYYRGLIPSHSSHMLVPFSIKKGSNIYGVIFGSGNLLGVDKFLSAAWEKDKISGEADFDIHRENLSPGQLQLPIDEFRPTKIRAFETDLEQRILNRKVCSEIDIVRLCFEHGVRRQHARPVLDRLKSLSLIEADFRVPQFDREDGFRKIRLKQPDFFA